MLHEQPHRKLRCSKAAVLQLFLHFRASCSLNAPGPFNVVHFAPSHIHTSQPMHGFHVSAMVEDMQKLNRHIMQYTLLNLT